MKVSDNHKLYFNGKLYKPVQYAKLLNYLCFGKAQQITKKLSLIIFKCIDYTRYQSEKKKVNLFRFI